MPTRLLVISLFAGVFSPSSSFAQATPAADPRLPPPKILRADPGFWARGVSSTTKQISLSFDQPLRPGFSAWAGPSALLPEEFGAKERFSADLKNLALDVKLAPGTIYVFGINERGKSGVGFQNAQGTSASPHFLVFQTAGEPAPEKAAPTLKESLPKNFAMTVDPAKARSLSFTFDRPMFRDSHGVILAAAGRPIDLTSVPFIWSEDGTTLTLNYQPQPNTLYRATLNSTFNIGFRSEPERIPLWPTTVTFRTTTPSEPLETPGTETPASDSPPTIVAASPGFWETGIDPATDRIALTFDQPLRAGYSAWTGPSGISPKVVPIENADGSTRPELYSADLTRVSLPVSLERGRIYVLALNEKARPGVGFQNPKGIPMPPRYLVFRTRGIPPESLRPPQFRGITPDPKTKIAPGKNTSLTITFDRPMNTGSHGLVLLKGGDPLDPSDFTASWDPSGTSVKIDVPLAPSSNYSARLNSDSNIGFRSAENIPLWPVELTFETASETPTTTSPNNPPDGEGR